MGVQIELGARIASVESVDGRVEVTRADGGVDCFEDVVVTAAAPLAARLCPGLAPAESARLARARYNGIVCASLVLRRPLEGYYPHLYRRRRAVHDRDRDVVVRRPEAISVAGRSCTSRSTCRPTIRSSMPRTKRCVPGSCRR